MHKLPSFEEVKGLWIDGSSGLGAAEGPFASYWRRFVRVLSNSFPSLAFTLINGRGRVRERYVHST